ncbi:olfactory receptor 10AG1-like, partial [Python bivittatus]|uniref:Olfactory receptor n=1 Tax=Python bivittatus TaxID=176946 RepID=A0A9F5J2J4_PYTBI
FYFMALMGNSLIFLLTLLNPTLHTPMYFFLWNLSFLEIGYNTTISPKTLMNLLSKKQTISFWGCGCQMCFFLLFGITECCLLCVMAYDRYVAICKPLQYPYIMNYRECAKLAAASWAIGVSIGLGQSISIFTLPFCGSNRISHFFCDIKHILRLASTNTYKDEAAIPTLTVVVILVPLLLILFSYILIISTILTMPMAKNRCKAFSTCSSHLTVVFIFYGTTIFTYIRPNSAHSMDSFDLDDTMKNDNRSCLTKFFLLGFSDFKTMQELLFSLVLKFYHMALMGNSLVLILIIASPCLHTPMYFFVSNLSFLEISYTSSISPKLLVNL